MSNASPASRIAVDEWLRVHRQLMDEERKFTEIAIKAASGEIEERELQAARQQLMALRSLCTTVYEKAFPQGPAQAT
jgi:hypothetical protein